MKNGWIDLGNGLSGLQSVVNNASWSLDKEIFTRAFSIFQSIKQMNFVNPRTEMFNIIHQTRTPITNCIEEIRDESDVHRKYQLIKTAKTLVTDARETRMQAFLQKQGAAIRDIVSKALFPLKIEEEKKLEEKFAEIAEAWAFVEETEKLAQIIDNFERIRKIKIDKIKCFIDNNNIIDNFEAYKRFLVLFREWIKTTHYDQYLDNKRAFRNTLSHKFHSFAQAINTIKQQITKQVPYDDWKQKYKSIEKIYYQEFESRFNELFQLQATLKQLVKSYASTALESIAEDTFNLGKSIHTYWQLYLQLANSRDYDIIKVRNSFLELKERAIMEELSSKKRKTDERYRHNVHIIKQERSRETARIQQEEEQSDKKYARKRAALQAQAKKAQAQRQKERERREQKFQREAQKRKLEFQKKDKQRELEIQREAQKRKLESQRAAQKRELEFQQEQMRIARSFQEDMLKIVQEFQKDLLPDEQ